MVLQILAVIVLQQKNKKIRIDSYNYLSIEETITFHNVIILIKLFVNMNKNNYYYNIFLEKGSQEDKSNICLCITKPYLDRIDLSEGIDVEKTIASKDFDICHYWYFLNKGFKFQPNVCNKCHDLLVMSKKPYY